MLSRRRESMGLAPHEQHAPGKPGGEMGLIMQARHSLAGTSPLAAAMAATRAAMTFS